MMTLTRPISRLGEFTFDMIEGFGRFSAFAGATFYWMGKQPSSWLSWRNLAPQLYAVGVMSIPVVALTGMFIGMILALEGFAQFAAIGQEDRIGGVINAADKDTARRFVETYLGGQTTEDSVNTQDAYHE